MREPPKFDQSQQAKVKRHAACIPAALGACCFRGLMPSELDSFKGVVLSGARVRADALGGLIRNRPFEPAGSKGLFLLALRV